jgi:hypothetical protein
LLLGLIAGAARSGAEAADVRTVWSLDAGLSGGVGRAAYDLETAVGSDTLMSRLEFPLDGLSAAARVLCTVFRGQEDSWRFAAEARLGIIDPSGLMKDYDWIEPQGFPRIPFSYTESSVEELSFAAGFDASKPISHRESFQLYWFAGYRYAYRYQSVQGYEGWQYVWNETAGAYDLYLIWSSSEALRYTLVSHALPVGLGLRLAAGSRLCLDLRAAWVPLYARDEDDHLLRYKLSTASGLGHGGACRVEAVFDLSSRADDRQGAPQGGAEKRRGAYLLVRGDVLGWRVVTTQTQEWYGDDPAESGDETGMVISGIGHVISLWDLGVSAHLGYRF